MNLNNSNNDWGLFVDIDKTVPYHYKKYKPSLIIINEEYRQKYYLKYHKNRPYQHVIFIKTKKTTHKPAIKNTISTKNVKLAPVTNKKKFRSVFILMTAIMSSGLLLLCYGNQLIKLYV